VHKDCSDGGMSVAGTYGASRRSTGERGRHSARPCVIRVAAQCPWRQSLRRRCGGRKDVDRRLVSGLIVCSQPALIRAQDVGLAEQGTARNVDMNDTAGRLHENKPALMPSRISKHGLAGRCRCIQALLMEEQIDLERMQFGYDADKVFQ
jgi:hypothetical protein